MSNWALREIYRIGQTVGKKGIRKLNMQFLQIWKTSKMNVFRDPRLLYAWLCCYILCQIMFSGFFQLSALQEVCESNHTLFFSPWTNIQQSLENEGRSTEVPKIIWSCRLLNTCNSSTFIVSILCHFSHQIQCPQGGQQSKTLKHFKMHIFLYK